MPVFRDFRNDDHANGAGIGARLDHHGRPLLAALARGMREANEKHVAPFHGFSGKSSYSSQSSCLTVSQARACSSSLVQELSSYSSLRRSYSSTRSKTKVSLVRGFTTRGGVDSGSSRACTCCSVSSITAASLPSFIVSHRHAAHVQSPDRYAAASQNR